MSDEIKMYCVFAMESVKKMNGNRGKLGAQAGHAYLHAWWDAEARSAPRYNEPNLPEDYEFGRYQTSGKAIKICLVVDTVDELKALEEAYRPICGVSLVRDAGLTCFDEPTVTCLGIGPLRDSDKGDDLKNLKVLI